MDILTVWVNMRVRYVSIYYIPSPGMCGCVTLTVMNGLHWCSLENHGHCSFPVLPLEW